MFASPSQILCTVFGVNIYYYGVIMALAITVGVLISDWVGNKYFGLKKDTIIDLAPYLIIFGIIGARLYYCVLNYDFYLRFPTEIIAIRHGGISIHGAMLGGAFGLWLFSIRHKISALKLCDVSVIGFLLRRQSEDGEISLIQRHLEVRQTYPGNCILHRSTGQFRFRIVSIFILHFCTKVFWMSLFL